MTAFLERTKEDVLVCFGAIATMTDLCDNYSLDIMELGNILNAAMEWYEKGLITKDDTDGIDLIWGNAEGAIEIINKVARKEGFGNLLADGPVRAAKQIGRGADKYITVHAKGLTMGATDIRSIKGHALSQATSSRGADHLRGGYAEFPEPPPFMREMFKERFGTEEAAVAGSYDKSRAVVYSENSLLLTDCLELCKINTEWTGVPIDIKKHGELFSLATGVEMDEKATSTAADRIWTVERAFSVREGITRKDDVLGGRWGSEPIPDGPSKGERIDPEKWDKLLDEYYQVRGWDSMGIPTASTLSVLGLEDIAEEFRKKGP